MPDKPIIEEVPDEEMHLIDLLDEDDVLKSRKRCISCDLEIGYGLCLKCNLGIAKSGVVFTEDEADEIYLRGLHFARNDEKYAAMDVWLPLAISGDVTAIAAVAATLWRMNKVVEAKTWIVRLAELDLDDLAALAERLDVPFSEFEMYANEGSEGSPKKSFDSLRSGNLNAVLSGRTPRILSEINTTELYMICAAKVTQLNWNEPGYTFIVTMDEEANWLSIDSFVLSDFLDKATTSTSFYPDYLELLVNNDSFIDLEVLGQSEENDEEYVSEAVFIADEEVLDALEESAVKLALLESLKITPTPKDPFRKELIGFISAYLSLQA